MGTGNLSGGSDQAVTERASDNYEALRKGGNFPKNLLLGGWARAAGELPSRAQSVGGCSHG